jgi:hypothetical protein
MVLEESIGDRTSLLFSSCSKRSAFTTARRHDFVFAVNTGYLHQLP